MIGREVEDGPSLLYTKPKGYWGPKKYKWMKRAFRIFMATAFGPCVKQPLVISLQELYDVRMIFKMEYNL